MRVVGKEIKILQSLTDLGDRSFCNNRVYPRSPHSYCRTLRRQGPAVSDLKILFPKVIGMNPAFLASPTSSSLIPPSGPTMKKIFVLPLDPLRTSFKPCPSFSQRMRRSASDGAIPSISE